MLFLHFLIIKTASPLNDTWALSLNCKYRSLNSAQFTDQLTGFKMKTEKIILTGQQIKRIIDTISF